MHVDEVDGGHADQVAQALQGGSDQAGAAVAVVEEATLRFQADTILGEVGFQGRDLGGDRPFGGRWDQKPERRWQRVRVAWLTPVLADSFGLRTAGSDGMVAAGDGVGRSATPAETSIMMRSLSREIKSSPGPHDPTDVSFAPCHRRL